MNLIKDLLKDSLTVYIQRYCWLVGHAEHWIVHHLMLRVCIHRIHPRLIHISIQVRTTHHSVRGIRWKHIRICHCRVRRKRLILIKVRIILRLFLIYFDSFSASRSNNLYWILRSISTAGFDKWDSHIFRIFLVVFLTEFNDIPIEIGVSNVDSVSLRVNVLNKIKFTSRYSW